MARDMVGKVIVITGASSGIGAATAIACAQAGMDVVLTARRGDKLTAVANRVVQCGQRAEIVVGDVADPSMAKRLLDVSYEELGRCDAVFANAGYGLDKAMDEMGMDELHAMFEVNFFASVSLATEAVARWKATETRGHVLMCSSCLAKFTLPRHAAYSASKAAQNHVCRAMRMELKADRIDVSSVHPITTATEFWDTLADGSGTPGQTPVLRKRTPGLFVQTPDRVARAVVKCLKRPVPEVWTSWTVRTMAGLMTIWPGLMDLAGRSRGR